MMERPKCQYKDCDNPGLLYSWGKLLCGDCFLEIRAKLQLKLNLEIENA